MLHTAVSRGLGWLPLVAGALAFSRIGLGHNLALAALVAPPLLLVFFRRHRGPLAFAAAWAALSLASLYGLWGGWDLGVGTMVAFAVIRPLPILAALSLDRWAGRRLGAFAATLVFPAAMVAFDYLVALSPMASVFSLVAGLYSARELAQVASLAGIWGLGFVVYWLAPAVAALADAEGSLKAAGKAARLPLAVAGLSLLYGSLRIGAADWGAPTVRVAGVSVAHERDYWDLIDRQAPRGEITALRPETRRLEELLFERSAAAVAAGAKILVWSEGACVLDEETEGAFRERAAAFARGRGVYLAAAVLTLRFGSELSDNKVLLFTPSGELAFAYTKTLSWYPTGSDGVLKTVDTPHGRLGAAICFDMDRPSFTRAFARLGADLVLVPAFDTPRIRPTHGETGLFRGLEYGFSIFRQTAQGTSLAADGRGLLRGAQDYFGGADRLFIADLPMKGERTTFALIGDLVAWLDLALLGLLLAAAARRGAKRSPRAAAG